jgi:hypothetical protein
MKVRHIKLKDCTQSIYQGIAVSKLRSEQGVPCEVFHASNLDGLRVGGEPTSEVLLVGKGEVSLEEGDVLVSHRAQPFRASVVRGVGVGCFAGQNVAVVRPDTSILLPEYLAVMLRSRRMQQAISRLYVSSVGVQMVRLLELRELEISIPAMATQEMLAQAQDALEHLERSYQEELFIRRTLLNAAVELATGGEGR